MNNYEETARGPPGDDCVFFLEGKEGSWVKA
jgi:hypothetical protein